MGLSASVYPAFGSDKSAWEEVALKKWGDGLAGLVLFRGPLKSVSGAGGALRNMMCQG
jgi:hypothetical protein